MAGYTWTPYFRLTPTDGAVEVVDLSATGITTPGQLSVDLRHQPVVEKREDVNRRVRPLRLGYRCEATLRFYVGGDMSDAAKLAKVANALLSDAYTVELSLDGGTTYREVWLRDWKGPKPADGKTFAGAEYDLRVECVDLIDEIPAIGSGSW